MNRFLRGLVYIPLFLFVKLFYRVKTVGRENLPESGSFLVVANHVSYVDALVLGVAMRGDVRFLMWRFFYERAIVGWVCRLFRSIPIEPEGSSSGIRGSLDAAIEALNAGDVVGLFPEGSMTRTGHVHAFKRGFEIIARRAGVPIVPAYVDGLWGSVFSFEGGRCGWAWPRSLRRHVTVCFGRPLPPGASAAETRRAVMELGSDADTLRKAHQRPLHLNFWRTARRMGGRLCMADSSGMALSWRRTLIGALVVSGWMRRRCAGEAMVGMMMPASVGAALINVAAVMCGKTPVNLNFTSSPRAVEEAVTRCGLRTVFTSRRFLGRIGMDARAEFVYLEDVMQSISGWGRLWSVLLAVLMPTFLAERRLMHRGSMDDPATVMFTSGSTGKPKGVMLSHHNVVSNIEAMADVFQFSREDTIMGVLPPFHSFGFTTTLWLPLVCGVSVVYHPNPLDAKGVGGMVEKHGATLIMGAPSFYALYTRACKPEQFRSLRLAIAGAQKLTPAVAQDFEKHFGLPISEGYGCTELTPVVSVNIDDVEIAGTKQFASRAGSVGRPLPGISVRVVDRETMAPAAEGATGIVLIRGPNVMMGYLDDPEATAEAVRDGWYVTGDLGAVDEDGFLYIYDRVSRFSKIGGEMVPHAAVEDALHEAAGGVDRHFAVLSAPDRVRGEKLVVIYDGPELDAKALVNRMIGAGVPNLWIPAPRSFKRVEAVPFLAGGKLNLIEARRMASETGALAQEKA